ncbi:MAG: phage tail tube protein [Sulfuricurvum sp.]|jgi:hypothetical protein|nr:phage tail tube protein [Sulfuricurvum sp.]
MSTNENIGISRKQRVFAKLETVVGTLVFPSGTTDFIRPAGNAEISQNPAFADSEELQNTLDVLDRFQNALPTGKWKIPMYLRPSGTVGSAPQGDALFEALQGDKEAVTAAIKTEPTAATSVVVIDTIAGGILPEKGVVTLAGTVSEKVYYTGITRVSRTATSATLTGCTRGYASTTAATHAIDQVVTLSSIFYKQETTSPSLTIWIESDHLVQGLYGAAVDEAVFEVSNEGAVKVTFSGQGMKMVYAGTSALSSNSVATNTHIHVDDASLFSADSYVYNKTQHDAGAAAVYSKISSVDTTTNILTLANNLGTTGATDDVICGYLPLGETAIGDPIESKDTTLEIDAVDATIKSCTVNVRAPKKYVEDEVGNDYATDYMEDTRDINSSLNIYFRKADAKYFTDGFANEEPSILFTFGDTAGSIFELYFKKCSLEVPAVNYATPAIELTMPMKALGTVGEDSCEIVVR